MGSVPVVVVVVLALAVVEGGACVTDPAAADADVLDVVVGDELRRVEVTAGGAGVAVCLVVGGVDPGTGDAKGVDVCAA